MLARGVWEVSGPVIDGNCGGGANSSRLALCFFGGGTLQTRDLLPLKGGELLQFYLRAGNFDNFERNYRNGCGGVTEQGQVMILEYSKDYGRNFLELRRFDLMGFEDSWVQCEERIPKMMRGDTGLRWRFEGTGNHFYYLDEIRLLYDVAGIAG